MSLCLENAVLRYNAVIAPGNEQRATRATLQLRWTYLWGPGLVCSLTSML